LGKVEPDTHSGWFLNVHGMQRKGGSVVPKHIRIASERLALCTLAHGTSWAESDNVNHVCGELESVPLSVDNTATPVIELEDRKCAT
jgi:hypothetical protein